MAKRRVIISGGGTGGHIFPAISIANALKVAEPDVEILFVGAKGRMEMEKVPAAGYKIIGLDISGFQRKPLLKNLMLPVKLVKSILESRALIKNFMPHVAVGVGGYASGPLLFAAGQMKVPYLIQEQNSYAGITNKRLAKKAAKVCVAFDGMESFFQSEKIIVTGNPTRKESVDIHHKQSEAYNYFQLSEDKKTILVIGGSLGAGTLNKCMINGLDELRANNVQVIWQTGKFYYKQVLEQLGDIPEGVKVLEFLTRIDLAYSIADVIVSRAGAGTLAELALVKKPVILVPSPNVAEDHQTKNAVAMVNAGAAIMVKDSEAEEMLVKQTLVVLDDKELEQSLSEKIGRLGKPDADREIAEHVLALAYRKEVSGGLN